MWNSWEESDRKAGENKAGKAAEDLNDFNQYAEVGEKAWGKRKTNKWAVHIA